MPHTQEQVGVDGPPCDLGFEKNEVHHHRSGDKLRGGSLSCNTSDARSLGPGTIDGPYDLPPKFEIFA